MANIEKYTRQVMPRQMVQTQASGEDFGAGVGRALEGMGQQMEAISQKIKVVEEKKQQRQDIINRAMAMDKYEQEAFSEFNRVQSEEDLVNPEVAKNYNRSMREKVDQYVSEFQGSDDAKARLYADLTAKASSYGAQINQNSVLAQRSFIMDRAGADIKSLSEQVRNNPSMLNEAFLKLGEIVDEYAPAMYPEDETSFTSSAQEQLVKGAIDSYIDSGQYQEAKDLINENPFLMDSLSETEQKNIALSIKKGLDEEEKVTREMTNKVNAIKTTAEILGIELNGQQVFGAVTGIQAGNTPEDRIKSFAKNAGLSEDEITPAVVASIGYGVTLPQADPNKDFDPTSGKLTARGIGSKIKPQVDSAIATKNYENKVVEQVNEFFTKGNRQAALAAMISFQKMIDDGAAVREGDIKLSQTATSWTERLGTSIASLQKGDPVSEEQLREMQAAAKVFSRDTLALSKGFIDPYLADARERNIRMLDIGFPQETYEDVFAGINSSKDKKKAVSMEDIQGIADQNGVTVEELIQQTATSSGKTVEQVKKDFGID